MSAIALNNIDPEDIDDLLIRVTHSFNITLEPNECKGISTFGELSDLIIKKTQGININDCTTQQAFYKIRSAIVNTLSLDNTMITPKTLLENIFPRKGRIRQIRTMEKTLGFKLRVLRPAHLTSAVLLIILFASIILLFTSWLLGLTMLLITTAGFYIATKTGKELNLKTVGEIVAVMAQEEYKKSRRYPQTVNKKEIEKLLIDWFSRELDISKSKLTKDATF
ncbi:hypothetical protein [Chitinophaga defluvii]|uniref:Acyl carrier protein n=1 Tax=Chitinophaga defluvii TaxID=3163343 RepID=A0ABV2SYX4_9BACT